MSVDNRSSLNRRSFLKKTLATAATITVAGTKSSGHVLGANEMIHVGVAGLNGRGSAHVNAFARMKGVQITYLIDPDTRTFDRRAAEVQRHGGNQPRKVQDVRRALEDRGVDAISIATPNHWHALMTIWAAQAGKHVYVEKPCSHNVKEGRIAMQTARKHNVIVQHGTQSRSDANWADVIDVIRSGKLGRLLISRGLVYKPRGTIGTRPNTDPPKEVDFDLWLGPAPRQPHHANLVHYNWHWFWDFGNGDIGNQGVHQMDIARWAIAGATLPRSVIAVGGRFGYSDQGQTPNTQLAVFDYGQTKLIFEVRGLRTDRYRGQGIGNIFHLEEGTIAGREFFPRNSIRPAPLPEVEHPPRRTGDHFANFIAAIRSGRHQDLAADIQEGHYSSALCHLANISYRLGQESCFTRRTRVFGGDKDANEALGRMEEHLRANELDLGELSLQVGPKLEINARAENFVGNAEANRLLTRAYRAGFVVPESV
jgi:predicted dehydrogenase